MTRPVTAARIQEAVARYYGLTVRDLIGPVRNDRRIVRPRQVAMFLARSMTRLSLVGIGARFGGRHHTTVMHGVGLIERLMCEDGELLEDIEAIQDAIGAMERQAA